MKRMKKVIAMMIFVSIVCCGCGTKYTCDKCGEETRDAYYNPFKKDVYYCEDCAKSYFAPLPYTAYKVQD